ncbi:Nucleotide-binding universal stress protein, UspA family [Variovorax sp. HW608]|uniref:universal stress protein n=1 Tax=Variovorax sp. HW608 TaxID=1034889 RepID=UPI00081F95F6|nr:universal stress protein [Variovorax sp. HW608]SCK53242.1 Nucleotide-binding universal stress protein, UspA family [Variovorax sp. HW608]
MKILIAVDGSPHTQKAIDYLAKHRHMFVDANELVVVHVCIGVPGHIARHLSKGTIAEYYQEETAKVIEPVRAQLARHDIANYRIDERHGHAAEEIIKSAGECGAELIVMGTHGHGLIARAIMGSVATKVVAETDISVLLVQ